MTDNPSPMPASSLTLAEIQSRLQAAIVSGDDAILSSLADGSRESRDVLLGVYRHAYTARLIEVLSSDYPFLRACVGDDLFRDLAKSYIVAHPSKSQNVRWFGTAFPRFLEGHESTAQHPEHAELAAIEKAVADAFDSADAPVLGFTDLSAYPPDEWVNLTFALHPSVTLLQLRMNAFEIWRSLKEGEPPPPAVPLACNQHLAVWRQGTSPKVRVMADEEAMMCGAAWRGTPFGMLCVMVATFDDPETAPMRAASYLQSWLASEMLTSANPQPLAVRFKMNNGLECEQLQ
jgi:hypothetical protein